MEVEVILEDLLSAEEEVNHKDYFVQDYSKKLKVLEKDHSKVDKKVVKEVDNRVLD